MTLRAVGLLCVSIALLAAAPAAAATRQARAEALYRRALEHIERNSPDSRRMAVEEIEQATLLDPARPDMDLTLARLCLDMRRYRTARLRYERVAAAAPQEPAAAYGLGMVWRHEWLKFLDPISLGRACDQLSAAARLKPSYYEAWIALAPLLVERQEYRAAEAAAIRASEAGPGRYEGLLAMATTAYRLGDVSRADRLFATAVPRLPRVVRARFEDIAPVASERDTSELNRLPPEEQHDFIERFWKQNDPDLTTPENEARLEYWARVSQAFFLFFDARYQEWDMRAEVYVRYGPPTQFDYNPFAMTYGLQFINSLFPPSNVLVWSYPELGLEVVMEDRTLNEVYYLPRTLTYNPDPRPAPGAAEVNDDKMFMRGGRGVFPVLPPSVEPMPVNGLLSMFESDSGGRVFAQVQADATPPDSLTADVVALDSLSREVYRARRRLSPSACDPLESQVADFALELPPGPYTIGLGVRDAHGRRGALRQSVRVAPPAGRVALSELVVTCGLPASLGERSVRLEPNPRRTVAGRDPLTAYFEIYHLAPGADGQSRFEYEYTVRSAAIDRRIWIQRVLSPREQVPPMVATREEQQTGELRRQFLSVPVQTLPPGRYKLLVRVRDLVSGAEAKREIDFMRVEPLATASPGTDPGTP